MSDGAEANIIVTSGSVSADGASAAVRAGISASVSADSAGTTINMSGVVAPAAPPAGTGFLNVITDVGPDQDKLEADTSTGVLFEDQ